MPIGRLPTLSSNFISGMFQKQKATTLSSDQNMRESGRKHDRDCRSYFPISWLVLGTLHVSNSSTANCVGEDIGCGGGGLCRSGEEQKQTMYSGGKASKCAYFSFSLNILSRSRKHSLKFSCCRPD